MGGAADGTAGDDFLRALDALVSDAVAQIAPYWRTLVESNRPRLPDPDNPDLLFAGGELVVPTPPAMDV